jgi:hypothetical protein
MYAAVFDAAQKRGGANVYEYTVMIHAYLLNDLREEAEDLFVGPVRERARARAHVTARERERERERARERERDQQPAR